MQLQASMAVAFIAQSLGGDECPMVIPTNAMAASRIALRMVFTPLWARDYAPVASLSASGLHGPVCYNFNRSQ